MTIQYLGHSCFLVEVNNCKILFDPFVSGNPLAADKVSLEDMRCDYMLASHGHQDHVAEVMSVYQYCEAELVAVFEVSRWFAQKGVKRVTSMNVGGSASFDFGRLTLVPAAHSSSMPDGSYGGVAAGFILQTPEGTLYFAGDTGLFVDMQYFGERYDIDVAFLPVGGHYTMDAADAAIAARWLKAKHTIGMHYDTFEPIRIDKQAARAAFEAEGQKLDLLSIKEKVSF